jgi:hypothetical protein
MTWFSITFDFATAHLARFEVGSQTIQETMINKIMSISKENLKRKSSVGSLSTPTS